MIVSEKYKYVYLAVAKTGTRSVYDILKRQFAGTEKQDHSRNIPALYEAYFTFATVRNPYDRACSAYWSTCMTEKDQYGYGNLFKKYGLVNNLESYLLLISRGRGERITSFEQMYWIKSNRVDGLVHQENIVEEFNRLPFVKKKVVNFPHINSSRLHDKKLRPVSEKLLTERSIKLINEKYKKDFIVLDYPIVESVKEYIKIYGK